MPYSLLLLDGDTHSNSLLVPALKNEFKLEICEPAHTALERMRSGKFDLLLLGSDLQDMPGIAFLRILMGMEFGKGMPVIFMPGAGTETAMAEAFKAGVDDYLPKPYDPRDLIMRIRAVLRRKYENLEHMNSELSLAGIQINPGLRRCIVDGKRVNLRPLEFGLLEILMRKSGRVLTRPYLLTALWEMSSSASTRAVDAMVSRLRRSLGKRAGKLIKTVSKMGYGFIEPDSI